MRAKCRSLNIAVVAILGLAAAGSAQAQWWSRPENLGDVVNSEYSEELPHLSYDGLSLYFISDRPPSLPGKFDIWVSHRASPEDPWGPPSNLGPDVNTSWNERGPCLSPDGHYLFFSSDRIQGLSQDLWMSKRDWNPQLGWGPWQPPVNLGPGINTKYPDFGAAFLKNGATGTPTLMFGRREGFGDADIYMSEPGVGATFGPGVLVEELSGPADDLRPTVRPDGLELFFNSNRDDSLPVGPTNSNDLWVSARLTIFEPWSTPLNLGEGINTEFEEQYPTISADGRVLIFTSNREPQHGNDLYMSRLEDLHPYP